jgi:hypothetical protein
VVAIHSRGVPHTADGHDTVYDWSKVLLCHGCGDGELVSFSHDCWAPPWEEEWDMGWSTRLTAAAVGTLRRGLASCPDPSTPSCECPVHESLRASRTQATNLGRDDSVTGKVALRDDGVPEFIR